MISAKSSSGLCRKKDDALQTIMNCHINLTIIYVCVCVCVCVCVFKNKLLKT